MTDAEQRKINQVWGKTFDRMEHFQGKCDDDGPYD